MGAKGDKLITSRLKEKECHNEVSISAMKEEMENGDTGAKYLPYMRFTKLFTVVILRSTIISRRPSYSTLYTSILLAFLTSKYYFQNQHTQKYLKFVKKYCNFIMHM